MSTSRPLPPLDAAHEQHDELLIAQLAAGDPLEPSEGQLAERLVLSCLACAELAADLRAIAAAVAREPVPARRRDFRIDPARARELRGSRWTRLLRRLSLPQSGALRPAAAGVMSLGLLLVVAGSVWPNGESLPSEPAAAPLATSAAGAIPPPEMPMTADDADGSAAPLSDAVGAIAASPAGEAFVTEAVGAEAPAADTQDTSTKASGAPERDPATLYRDRAETPSEALAAGGQDDRSGLAPEASPAVPMEEGLAMEAVAPSAPQATEPVRPSAAQPMATPLAADVASNMAGVAQQELADDASAELRAPGVAQPGASGEAASSDGIDVESLVVWVGILLMLGGALVLLLVWFARRARDPLLR
jgi:hypothetical protein